MAVYGYCRVSTGYQAKEGISLDDQQRRINARAAENNWMVDRLFVEEGVTGGHEWRKRPEGGKLFARLRPGDVVIVAKIDRAFRSSLDTLRTIREFGKRKIQLYLLDVGGEVTEHGLCGLIVTILGAVAEFERELISERVRNAAAHQRSQGRVWGHPPWGYTVGADKHLTPHPLLAETTERLRQLYVDGVPIEAICREAARATDLRKPYRATLLPIMIRGQPPGTREQLIHQRRRHVHSRIVRAAVAAARSQGRVWSSPPWGYTVDGDNRLIPQPGLAGTTERLRQLYVEGALIDAICEEAARAAGLKKPNRHTILSIITRDQPPGARQQLIQQRRQALLKRPNHENRRVPWGYTVDVDGCVNPHLSLGKTLEAMRGLYVTGMPLNAICEEAARATGLRKPSCSSVLSIITRDQPPGARQQLIQQRREQRALPIWRQAWARPARQPARPGA